MSILTRSEIIKRIEDGSIVIDPFNAEYVGPGSIDLHLGEYFRVFHPSRTVVEVNGNVDYTEMTDLVHHPDGILLMPGETVLGMTIENCLCPQIYVAGLKGRSRFARIGLLVHISAGFMQPGISNHQLLEMSNFSPNPLLIKPGTRVCQFIFQETIGEARYQGRFQNQTASDF
jgi:dCTP deaminase